MKRIVTLAGLVVLVVSASISARADSTMVIDSYAAFTTTCATYWALPYTPVADQPCADKPSLPVVDSSANADATPGGNLSVATHAARGAPVLAAYASATATNQVAVTVPSDSTSIDVTIPFSVSTVSDTASFNILPVLGTDAAGDQLVIRAFAFRCTDGSSAQSADNLVWYSSGNLNPGSFLFATAVSCPSGASIAGGSSLLVLAELNSGAQSYNLQTEDASAAAHIGAATITFHS